MDRPTFFHPACSRPDIPTVASETGDDTTYSTASLKRALSLLPTTHDGPAQAISLHSGSFSSPPSSSSDVQILFWISPPPAQAHSPGSRCSPCADRMCRLFHWLIFFTVVYRVLIACCLFHRLRFLPALCTCGSMSVSQADDVWLLWVVACETGVRCA